ncbi:hypothetical protein I1A62_10290 [Rhodococcus sp. USK10]|uniref:Uncharacterized protein n=1 Tax=Rhodococcus wratislaviensis TaxID=44752 RepID=A0A402CBQ3_RHOWR|nr:MULTISPECIES: hypothetical protein [Rhodococcus]QYB04804.1 hypothetical protein I1A62_10290 [Rhodococcus sp. USK10]GCE41011.1 hypothetical protein Rhow_004654 [Rhodococcus wratislaviensis]
MFGTNIGAMVALLVVALVVVPVSFGVAARADAKVRGLSRPRVPDPDPRGSVADVDERREQWRQLATRAWLICGGASLVAVAVVGVLICVA